MVFLAPLFLFGLLAALIPIAIHLIRRERPPKVVFGSIRFLKNTPKKLILFQHTTAVGVAVTARAIDQPLSFCLRKTLA